MTEILPDDGTEEVAPHPVDVFIVGDARSENEAALLSAWSSWTFQGPEDAVQILATNRRRKRAIITVGPGFPAPVANNPGTVFIGASRAQTQAGKAIGGLPAPSGGILSAGMQVEVQASNAMWAAPDGTNKLTVIVYDEWYAA